MHDVQESVRQGRSFAAPLAKAGVFPPMVPQMVSVGEESGTLVEMLASIADFYEDEVETATAQLSATIEPVLIVGLGIIIGGMVISLYLPIFTLYGELAQTGSSSGCQPAESIAARCSTTVASAMIRPRRAALLRSS